jgi:hypothetical protein
MAVATAEKLKTASIKIYLAVENCRKSGRE